MSAGFGYNNWLALGEEVTYGTAVARTKFIEIQEESLQGKQQIIAKPSLRQISQLNRVQGKKSVEGSFTAQMGYESLEKILKHAMGTMAAVTGASPYTHAATLASALPVGLTLEVPRDASAIGGSSAYIYEGCQINKLTLKQDLEDILMVTCDIVGEDWSLSTATIASFATFNAIPWTDLTTFTLNGAAVAVDSWELTIENNLDTDRYKLLSRIRKGLGRKSARKITLKITCEYEQLTELALFEAQTTLIAAVITYNNGLAAGSNKQLQLALPKLAVQGDHPTVSGQAHIPLELKLEAFQSAAANDEMTATLINSQSVSQA